MLEIIDRSLRWLTRHGGNSWPAAVHPLMATGQPSRWADEDYSDWLPIASTTTIQQLNELEATIGHRLPPDYRAFLQHQHFYELHLGGADFFPHPVDEWQPVLRREMLENRPDALQAGYIPFANYGGAGDILCFDAGQNQVTADYPVIFYDHEGGQATPFSDSFATLLPQLLAETPERDV